MEAFECQVSIEKLYCGQMQIMQVGFDQELWGVAAQHFTGWTFSFIKYLLSAYVLRS